MCVYDAQKEMNERENRYERIMNNKIHKISLLQKSNFYVRTRFAF